MAMAMMNNTPIQTYNNDKSTLYIQQLQQGVTKELLFKEFTKYGALKHVRHFPKTSSALIAYENIADAEEARRNLNHTRILKKEISIAYFQDKDVLSQNKKFNLFIKDVPPTLATSVLHNFLQSEFGNIASLMLKKKNDSDQNLGYGYVQFEKEEDFNKILQRQQDEGKITMTNSTDSFNVQKFSSERPKAKTNKIHITGLFEQEISAEEKEAKYNQIMGVMEGIKRNLGDKQIFTIHTEYNEQKKSFWTLIEFAYSNDEEEDTIYQTVKESIVENFKNTTGAPQITFKANESSERNLILLGVKNDIKEATLARWLLNTLNIIISEQNIRIRLPTQKAEPTPQTNEQNKVQTYSASLFFDSKKDGEKFMIFAAKPQNTQILSEIFETKHKVTLFLKKEELNEIKRQSANMANYYKGGNFNSQTQVQKSEIIDPKAPLAFMKMPPYGMIPNAMFAMQNMPTGFYPQQMQVPVLPPIAPPKEHVQHPASAATKQNIFLQFQKLSPDEKKQQVEDISSKITSNRNEFDAIADEEGKRAILGQIIYYKIQNFGESNKARLINELNKTPEEANRLITEFHQEVAKITGMLIDKEIFTIEEIIEIVLNPKELLERCLEATDLLTQNQQN